MFSKTVAIFSLMLLAAATRTALTQGVGGGSPTDTSHTLHLVASIPEDPTDWSTRIGTAAAPIGVQLDPSGPVWSKHFQTQNGRPIGGGVTGPIVGIEENLLVGGSISWTGWHSDLATGGFIWYTGPGGTLPPFRLRVNDLPVPVTFAITGSSLDVSFALSRLEVGSTSIRSSDGLMRYPFWEPSTCTSFRHPNLPLLLDLCSCF
jgi:hypothetical protein